MPSLLLRILAAVATGLTGWLELLLAKYLGITPTPEEHQWLAGICLTGALVVGGVVKDYLAKRWPKRLALDARHVGRPSTPRSL